jgi:hypothetical protein
MISFLKKMMAKEESKNKNEEIGEAEFKIKMQ